MLINERLKGDTVNRLRQFIQKSLVEGQKIIAVTPEFEYSNGRAPHWFRVTAVVENGEGKRGLIKVQGTFKRPKTRFQFSVLEAPQFCEKKYQNVPVSQFSSGVISLLCQWK